MQSVFCNVQSKIKITIIVFNRFNNPLERSILSLFKQNNEVVMATIVDLIEQWLASE
jgi:hypothetical protein